MVCSRNQMLHCTCVMDCNPLTPKRNHLVASMRLYQFLVLDTKFDRSIDTMLRLIFLFCVSGKPAIQGICSVGVFKILGIADSFTLWGFIRTHNSRRKFEYPLRKNKIVVRKITGFKE